MTKELDRRFRHVGRIKRSWGTTHKPTIRRMEEMMSGLFERGRLDILRLIQDGTYSPLQVYDAYRTNELERLPTAATLAPLRESMEKWIAKKECSESHRRSLSQSLRHLIGTSGNRSSATLTVSSIPNLLTDLRDRMQSKHPRSWNLARAAAQAYLAETMGRNTPLYHAVQDLRPLRVTPQRIRHPLTPYELQAITDKMDRDYSRAAWAMAYTGMGPSEYWGKWTQLVDRIHISGTKRAGRDRDVPRIYPIYGPTTLYPAFRRALRDASDSQVTPYDLRRSFANWMEAAGVVRARRRAYMGHGAKDTTDLYEKHEVEKYLIEDADRLRAWIGRSEPYALHLEQA